MLAVNVVNTGETTTLRCKGRIVAGDEVSRLKSAVLCHQDAKTLVLDLAQVETMDGAGMGLLAFMAGWTRVVGIRLKLANPSHHVRELLELTNLDTVLDLGASQMAAAPSFERRPSTNTSTFNAHP